MKPQSRNEREGVRVQTQQLADALMSSVYCPVAALVSLDEGGTLLGLRLFDTQYAPLPAPAEGCAAVWLIFGHPDGWRALHPAEEERLAELRALAGEKSVRVFLAGEELGCIEPELG